MNNFFNRLDKFLNYKGLNDNKITIQTGISNGLIGKARKRGSLSQENISKILLTYPNLNANWLFTGEGKMEKSPNILAEEEKPYYGNSDDKKIKQMEKALEEKEKYIKVLEENNNLLKEKLGISYEKNRIAN